MEQKEIYAVMQQWVPTEERLPDEDLIVLMAIDTPNGDPVWFGFMEGGQWVYESGMRVVYPVTHWMEMPAPPAIGSK